MKKLVLIKGGGDLATGIAHRLYRAGFAIIITEIPCPTVIRRTVAFAQAVYAGKATVEDVTAVLTEPDKAYAILREDKIAVIVDPAAACIDSIKPWAVVDAIIAKYNTGTSLAQAPIVIGVGPGFTAGVDVHAVIETMRGHDLGRVITAGSAQPNTGIPGEIGGYTLERLLRAPEDGIFQAVRQIGEMVKAGDVVAVVGKHAVIAKIGGILRGLLQDGLPVTAGMKIGDIDPRCRPEHCYTISDKARAIGGGVLEALMWLGGNQRG
ncbi:MAG: selenium-dependent molybdenum cofactor biosynthesis protein YqeB [Negativicutes bacterium]|nr:selenium-dependent molybdenum cofactor biosynthesis protein YqeB [Negativicutes bacterium]